MGVDRGERGLKRCFGLSVDGVLVRKPPELAGKRLTRVNSRRFPFAANLALRTAVSRFILAAVFRRVCPDLQVDSRTRELPSSSWISGACHVWRWSKPSGSGFDGFRGRLNPIEIGLFVGDPFLDRLPGRLDGLHGVDVAARKLLSRPPHQRRSACNAKLER